MIVEEYSKELHIKKQNAVSIFNACLFNLLSRNIYCLLKEIFLGEKEKVDLNLGKNLGIENFKIPFERPC